MARSRKRAAPPAAADAGTARLGMAAAKKLVPDPTLDSDVLESFMAETNGGGSAEKVPGFDIFRAITAGFETRRVAGPTTLRARPDGGFYSEGTPPPPPVPDSQAKPENVIGVDSRVLVPDTAAIPWRCICHLEVEFERGPVGYGTGFLIGPTAVLTAAHVIVNPTAKRKARHVRVIPGRNGGVAPYGYFVANFSDCKVPAKWLNGDAEASGFDFAIIPIPDDYKTMGKPTAERLGYFGLKCFADKQAAEAGKMLFVNNAGYPYEADKPYGTLWYNAGRVRDISERFVEYMVDTEGGQSGSPVYFYDEETGQRYVIAIHTTGDFVNRGLRIRREVFDTVRKWADR